MQADRIIYRVHAVERMFQRNISTTEVSYVLENGEVIEDYPEDSPYPSKLILGWHGTRPLHIVAAYNAEENLTIVITVYEPDAAQWEPDFRRRKR
ncbi:MAG: DUF4258 domain-containing protein [Candidatus Zixiibacteriota bacterium]